MSNKDGVHAGSKTWLSWYQTCSQWALWGIENNLNVVQACHCQKWDAVSIETGVTHRFQIVVPVHVVFAECKLIHSCTIWSCWMCCQVLNYFATEAVLINTNPNSCLQLITNRGELPVFIPGWVKLNRKLRLYESFVCLDFSIQKNQNSLYWTRILFSIHIIIMLYFFVIVYYLDHLLCSVWSCCLLGVFLFY